MHIAPVLILTIITSDVTNILDIPDVIIVNTGLEYVRYNLILLTRIICYIITKIFDIHSTFVFFYPLFNRYSFIDGLG